MSKFIYDENELTIVESQCELCRNYNDGKYSDCCPKENIDRIKMNEISCPYISEDSFFTD